MKYPYLGFGLGLRAPHYEQILAQRPKALQWLEIISENFIDAHRGYWNFLADLRTDYRFVMHGVSLSVGSTDPLNREYLSKIKGLAEFLDVPWFSDHLCWTGVHGRNTHDLLPVPYTRQSLAHIIPRIRQVQDHVGCPFILENPSTYLEFAVSDIPEWEFLATLAHEADCGLLLDVNNIYVNSCNHGYDAHAYIDAIPAERIAQIHLAGHTRYPTHIVDTHDHPVPEEVWELYAYTVQTKGRVSAMVEWDEKIPPLDTLLEELQKARHFAEEALLEPAA